ncbi:MAG: MarR family transcriptional regulator [Crocinitomicaceae bacterium]|nr:MarR family transcriptional regulator [Crocinitomicaceae bacterium]
MKIDDVLKSKFKTPQIRASVNVRYTSNFMAARQNAFMSKFELTMPQFNILRILRGAGEEITVNTIKERMVEKSPNTTRLMDKLIDKGLIVRTRCSEDRRVVYIEITKNGLDLLLKIDEEFSAEDLLPNNLTDDECIMLSDLLDKLRG